MLKPIKINGTKGVVSDSTFSDHTYLQGIIENDSKVLNKIYECFLPSITKFVLENRGTESDARDVFQDGLVIIYKKLKSDSLELTSGFHTYLFSVCRFVWLRELKKKRRTEVTLDDNILSIAKTDIEKAYAENEKQKFFKSKLSQMPAESQKVLQLFFNKKSMKEIAEVMGYTEAYAKRKKYKAKQQLITLVRRDYRFSQM